MSKDTKNKKSGILERDDYLSVTYSEDRSPYGTYPEKLAQHISNKYLQGGGKLLDVGCGRGEYLNAFSNLGYETAGVDISAKSVELSPDHPVKVANLEQEPMPYEADSFDVVFSKSVIEHIHEPVIFLEQMYSALKPGGTAIIMTPSWEHNYRGAFYIDHTHVTPFTPPSLNDCMRFARFQAPKTEYFWQLPFVWNSPSLLLLTKIFAKLPLSYRPMHEANWPHGFNKYIRFSKEAMLICRATKPLNE